MRIIDSHAHIGHDWVFDCEFPREALLKSHEKHGVSGAIVQPATSRPYLEDTAAYHDDVHEFCKAYPGRFWGMACINPHFRPEDFDKEARRCMKELGFVGIKMTPIAHAVNPSLKNGMHVFEIAAGLGVPVMVHTGAGGAFSDPQQVVPAAQAFKDLKIVLAHAGSGGQFETQALAIAKQHANVYLEPSWVSMVLTKRMIDAVGVAKVMFSSDHASNVPLELAKYRAIVHDEQKLERVLSGTVIEVFQLRP